MSLSPGTRLGPYEILSPLGAGGMGEVYRARDTRLGREVAVKILPPGLTDSEQARQRFEREARTISQLSHPHICALYDVGREGSTEYLVMELLEGQTLADRIAKGSVPLDQALRLGAEIADALEKAHRQGIVHRDLKPGNIMLTSSGAKVLDFGLARALGPSDAVVSATGLPTETPLTEAGMVLGTVQYMAPEQLEGKEADARTDIFALGLVLYEMATGRQAFSGATRASLIGSILRDEPDPVSRSAPLAPRALDRVVAICLAKEPEERWQTARDVGLQLEGIRQERSAPGAAVAAPGPRASRLLPWAVAAAAVVLAAWGLSRGARPASSPSQFRTSPASSTLDRIQLRRELGPRHDRARREATRLRNPRRGRSDPAVDPGPRLARAVSRPRDRGRALPLLVARRQVPRLLRAGNAQGDRSLEVSGAGAHTHGRHPRSARRELGRGRDDPLRAGQRGADHARARSRRQARAGHAPGRRREGASLAPLSAGRPPLPLRGPQARIRHRSGGECLSSLTYLASLEGKEKRLVLTDVTSPAYVPPGYLLFGRTNSLMAVACDPKTLEPRGEPVLLASGIEGFTAPGSPFFSASERLLVYSQRAGIRTTRMVWYDRSGNELATVGPAGEYLAVGMSPDGGTAVAARAEEPLPPDLWLFDTAVGRGIRLTRDNLPQLAPVVAPGGQRIFFSSYARGPWDIWTTTPKGAVDVKPFLESETVKAAKDVSPDGRFLLYREFNAGTLGDLKIASLDGDPAPRTFVGTADDETSGDFSPDGRWVAYVSDESGRPEVYVASFPDGARRLRVTSGGRLAASLEPRRQGALLHSLGPTSSPFPSRARATIWRSGKGTLSSPFPSSSTATRASTSPRVTTWLPTAGSSRSSGPATRARSRSRSFRTGPRR